MLLPKQLSNGNLFYYGPGRKFILKDPAAQGNRFAEKKQFSEEGKQIFLWIIAIRVFSK